MADIGPVGDRPGRAIDPNVFPVPDTLAAEVAASNFKDAVAKLRDLEKERDVALTESHSWAQVFLQLTALINTVVPMFAGRIASTGGANAAAGNVRSQIMGLVSSAVLSNDPQNVLLGEIQNQIQRLLGK